EQCGLCREPASPGGLLHHAQYLSHGRSARQADCPAGLVAEQGSELSQSRVLVSMEWAALCRASGGLKINTQSRATTARGETTARPREGQAGVQNDAVLGGLDSGSDDAAGERVVGRRGAVPLSSQVANGTAL